MIQNLANKILAWPVDYSKSLFKHPPQKIKLFGSKLGKADLEKIREEQREAAEYITKQKEEE